MSRRHLFRWTLLLALGASVGCKKSPTCELLHERLRACLPDLAGDSAAFVATCQAREDDFEAPVACSPETACDVFDRCFQAALERAHHKDLGEARRQRVESIKEAVAKGRYREARVDCLRFEKQPPPSDVDWQSICTELPRTATAALKERMKGLREAGQPDDDLVCYQLLDFAARVSGEEGRGAEVLCDEVRTSADAARPSAHSAPAPTPKPSRRRRSTFFRSAAARKTSIQIPITPAASTARWASACGPVRT